jgi:hypothetical protein
MISDTLSAYITDFQWMFMEGVLKTNRFGDPDFHSFFQTGFRFSRKALRPSLASAVFIN